MEWDDPEAQRRQGLSQEQAAVEADDLVSTEWAQCSGMLDLSYLPIAALPPAIASMTWLTSLDCIHTHVSDLSPLAGLTALASLDCCGTGVSDLSPLAGLPVLASLDCSGTDLIDLSSLSDLTALASLTFRLIEVTDLSPLFGLTGLASLDCSLTHVSDLSPLAGLTALTSLACTNIEVKDLSPLAGLTALVSLDCSGTQVSHLSPLSDLTALTSLDCSGTQVCDLSPLEGLTALASLDCSQTEVSDLSPLAGLTALASLDCGSTEVTDLSPLSGLTALASLGCDYTYVSDLSPLRYLPSLSELRAHGLPLCSIPSEHLSQDHLENCLPRLRVYWDNLDGGAEPFRQHKLFLLGNGTVGKTQVARALRAPDIDGEVFDTSISSTHGIELHPQKLPAPADPRHENAGEAFTAKIWDFGGQDIYHGTHALFLKTRAIFLICWDAISENAREHVIDGVPYRNRPLAYWLDYVREFAGPNAEVILVQTKDDLPGAAAAAAEIAELYPDTPRCSTSAKDEEGFNRLKRLIAEAVGRIEAPALPIIPSSQRRVIDAITAARKAGTRTMDREAFATLCRECGLIGAPEHMLHFLHHTGEVFHAEGRFGDQIIIDQRWALDAIYAVFDRERCWQKIRAERGRFTLSLLAETVWQDFSPDDRANLLSMMLQCGMAFRYIEGEEGEREAIYIAPDLLPERGEPGVRRWIDRYWDDAAPKHRRVIGFDLLHDGLMREIMRGIGNDAGLHAVYWKNGLLFFDDATGGLAMIEASWPDPEGWAGEIAISTQRRGAAELASRLEEHLLAGAERLGLSASAMPPLPRNLDKDRPAMADARTAPVIDPRATRMPRRKTIDEERTSLRPAAAQPLRPVCYVSYTRQDQQKGIAGDHHLVDALRQEAEERQIDLITYEDHLQAGDTITGFTDEIARAQVVAALIGPHYLRRPHCYHELERCWAEAALDEVRFKRKMRPFPLGGAALYPDNTRGKQRIVKAVAAYWQSEFERCHALFDRDLEEELIAKFGKRWATETSPILRALQDLVANYADFDDFRTQLFADLEALRYKPDHDPQA